MALKATSQAQGRPFPTLSLFAIYTSTPATSPSSSAEYLADEQHPDDDDAAREASKLLFFSSAGEALSKDRKARLMGTAMGMADFARMLSPGGAPSVRAVHSQKQRMVWLEPETGFFIHATIDLPSPSRHSRDASNATITPTTSVASSPILEDASLLASLALGYHEYRLLRGSFARTLEEGGRDVLRERLKDFWDRWVPRWSLDGRDGAAFERAVEGLERSPLSTRDALSQLAPLLSQFTASNPSALPILLHGSGVLHLSLPPVSSPALDPIPTRPSSRSASSSSPPLSNTNTRPVRTCPPPMSESDLVALVHHLVETTVVRPITPPVTKPPTRQAKKDLSSAKASRESSSWNSYYHLSLPSVAALSIPSIPSMPTIPGLPALPSISLQGLRSSSPATSSGGGSDSGQDRPDKDKDKTKASKEKNLKEHALSGWALRSVSWGLGRKTSMASIANADQEGSAGVVEGAASAAGSHATASAEGAAEAELVTESVPASTDAAATDGTAVDTAREQLASADVVPAEDAPSTRVEQTPSTLLTSSPASHDTSIADVLPPSPTTPGVDLTPDVDAMALAEAMAEEENAAKVEAVREAVDSQVSATMSEGLHADAEKGAGTREHESEVFEIFCGEDIKAEVRRYERGLFTLALATLPLADDDAEQWLTSRANRLLEAVETVLESVTAITPSYPHRNLIKRGALTASHGWHTGTHEWSGKATAEENEVSAALFDCMRGLKSNPAILESYVRLSSSQWIVGRRTEDTSSTVTTTKDVFLVLPAIVGKDGSLIDAAEELRKLDRAQS